MLLSQSNLRVIFVKFHFQILSVNPMFANNPQMREMIPMMIQQMQRPEMQSLYTNPRAMEALMQIQQGMQTLQREAPGAVPG